MDTHSARLAHDLKMPIQLIYSCVQLLEMEISPNARAEGYLQMLLRSADQLNGMVKTALEAPAAQKNTCAMQIQDVVSLARNVSRECALLADEKGIRLHFETNASAFRMPTNPEKLRRILHNLIANALRFTPAGGHISVSLRVMGDKVELAVRDTGCGIPEGKQREIFLPGVSEGSTGWGLSIVRDYARELGGDVQLESRLGYGSCFTVCLPVRSLRLS